MAETLRTNSTESTPRTFCDATCPRELSVYGLLVRDVITASRALFDALGAAGTVHWDPYVGAWLIVGPDEVAQVLTDDSFVARRLADQRTSGDVAGIAMTEVAARMLLQRDGAQHTKLKRVVQRVLSPSRIRALEPFMRELADELLPGDRPVALDFVVTVARTFPVFVLAELLGIPRADLPMVLAGSDAMTQIVGGLHYTLDPAVHAKARALFDHCLAMVHERRAHPGADGASAFVEAADAAGGYDDMDIAANLMMLVASGHQTMPGLLGIAVHDALRAGAELGQINRVLAEVTPSRFVGRVATDPVVVGGCRIEPGDAVLVLLAAANWTLLREHESGPLRHFAFGHGRHRCAGAALAQLEGTVLFEKVRSLWPQLRISTDARPSWNNNANLPALTSLPIEIGTPWTTG
jgi:cytochrome P450